MANTRRRLWRCPKCRAGILAPSKLRKIDTRRWCLECSGETGKLVERKCKVNEDKSKTSKNKASKKAAKKRGKLSARKHASKQLKNTFWLVDGLDLRKEFVRICAHPHLRDALQGKERIMEVFVQRNNCGTSYHGSARFSAMRIKLWMRRGEVTRFQAAELVCHEIAHLINDDRREDRGGGRGHGEGWWAHFLEIVREAYGVNVEGAVVPNRWSRDQAIIKALQTCEWLTEKKKPPRKPRRPKDAKKIAMRLFPMTRSEIYHDWDRVERLYI